MIKLVSVLFVALYVCVQAFQESRVSIKADLQCHNKAIVVQGKCLLLGPGFESEILKQKVLGN